MAAVRAFSRKKGPRPEYDLKVLRKCASRGVMPPSTGSAASPTPATAAAMPPNAGNVAGSAPATATAVPGTSGADDTRAAEASAPQGEASEAKQAEVKEGAAAAAPMQHSHYGTRTFLQLLLTRPEVLQPVTGH